MLKSAMPTCRALASVAAAEAYRHLSPAALSSTIPLVSTYFSVHSHAVVVDVRAPTEFAQSHIPRSANIPLLNDAERSLVGTLYKQAGPFPAVAKGVELFETKSPALLSQFQTLNPHNHPMLLYCWRGGMRSTLLSKWLHSQGFTNVSVLSGGFKAFRADVASLLTRFGSHPLVVINGQSGSGKTEMIQLLKAQRVPAIDLEHLAAHRGSAFGRMGVSAAPPTSAQFENLLACEYFGLADSPRIAVEYEDRIGELYVPQAVRRNIMLQAPHVFVSRSFEARAERIAREYGKAWSQCDSARVDFERQLHLLSKYLSKATRDEIAAATMGNDLTRAAKILLSMRYDFQYAKILAKHASKRVASFDLDKDYAKAVAFVREFCTA